MNFLIVLSKKIHFIKKDPLNKFSYFTGKAKIYYTYRLTCVGIEQQKLGSIYYIGYRGCTTHPKNDLYYSSSDSVKELIKKVGKDKINKKFLGIYAHSKEALFQEVIYHKTLNVALNPKFLNKACQTTTAFTFDNTGRIQTVQSNEKRSKTLKGKDKHTAESKNKISDYQKNERIRSGKEKQILSDLAKQRNSRQTTCPHCGKVAQYNTLKQWHFEHCKENPNPSAESILKREKLRQQAIERNTKKK